MMLDFIFGKTYTMPSVEEINSSANKSLDEETKKNKADCAYMYNLLNKCLTKAVNSNNDYTSIDFDKYKLNTYSNTNITKCDDFNDYNKELKARGIELRHYDSYRNNYVKYDSKDKILTIYGW
jgi:hypothetical protein